MTTERIRTFIKVLAGMWLAAGQLLIFMWQARVAFAGANPSLLL